MTSNIFNLERLRALVQQKAEARLRLEPVPADVNIYAGAAHAPVFLDDYRLESLRPFGVAEISVVSGGSADDVETDAATHPAYVVVTVSGGSGPYSVQSLRLVFGASSLERARRVLRPMAKTLRTIADRQRIELAKWLIGSEDPMKLLESFGGRPLRVVSAFSGISAFSAATTADKFRLVAVMEIGADGCCVLNCRVDASAPLYMPDPNAPDLSNEERTARRKAIEAVKHLPKPWTTKVINLGDITQVTDDDLRRLGVIDVLEGGPPCQAFSTAGNRDGLEDPRGMLTRTWIQLLDRMRRINHVRYAVFENVPGILGNETNPWGDLLGHFAGIGGPIHDPEDPIRWSGAGHLDATRTIDARSLTWRSLDAQHFGVAQRRLRLFAVIYFGNGTRDRRVLHERLGGRRCGDADQGRAGTEEASPDIVFSCTAEAAARSCACEATCSCSDRGSDSKAGVGFGPASERLQERQNGSGDAEERGDGRDPTGGLTALAQRVSAYLRELVNQKRGCLGLVDRTQIGSDIMPTMTARTQGGGSMLHVVHPEIGDLVHPRIFPPLMGSAAGLNRPSGLSTETECIVVHTTCFKPGASEDACSNGAAEEIAPTLVAGNGGNSVPAAVVALLNEWKLRWVIRKLMPKEAEVLQGFPKGWTDCLSSRSGKTDTRRFRLIGNSIAVPVYWLIFERLWRVEVLSEHLGMKDIPEELLELQHVPFTGKDITLASREEYWRKRSRLAE